MDYPKKRKTHLKGVLITRIDSDDLFHKNYFEEVRNKQFKSKRALVCKKGYVLFSGDKPSLLKRLKWRVGRLLSK